MVAQAGHAVADELDADPIMRREPLAMRDPVSADLEVRRDSQIRRAPNASGLYDVLDLILDKGIVVDAFVRVSLVGIELLTVDLRVVIASVDTYLRYAEGVERLQVYNRSGAKRLPDMVGKGATGMAAKKGAEKVKEAVTGDDDDEEQNSDDEGIAGTITHGLKRGIGKLFGGITGSGSEEEEDDSADDESQDEGSEEAKASDRGQREERGEQSRDRHRGREARPAKNGNAGRSKSGSRR
jgi:gas vesicle structural protein